MHMHKIEMIWQIKKKNMKLMIKNCIKLQCQQNTMMTENI